MKRRNLTLGFSALVLAASAVVASAPSQALAGRGNGPVGVIYVTGQDLYFDTIGLKDLPQRGPFQALYVVVDDDGNIVDARTEYGPGDQGYVGGRWEAFIVDLDMNPVAIRYFECPLLGPGREEP
jgi:hypothetical protein